LISNELNIFDFEVLLQPSSDEDNDNGSRQGYSRLPATPLHVVDSDEDNEDNDNGSRQSYRLHPRDSIFLKQQIMNYFKR